MHYNGVNGYIFLNGVLNGNAASICLRNLSKDFSVDNMIKSRLSGYVYAFSVDGSVDFDDILDIHK